MKPYITIIFLTFFLHAGSQPLKSDSYISTFGHLTNTLHAIQKQKECTVAFLGGSITQNPGWRDKVEQYLQKAYPATRFAFIRAGIASLGSVPHSFRLQRDVLDLGKPDLLFLEAAVNDHANQTKLMHQERAMEGIIRHSLQSNPKMNIVVMAFADEDKTADYNNRTIPQEVAVHERLAKYYKLPFINLAKEVQERINNKEFTWKDDFKDLHPSPFGQELYFQTIQKMFENETALYKKQKKPVSYFPKKPFYTGIYDKGTYQPISDASQLNEFSIVENWLPKDAAPTRPGYTAVPVLEGSTPGASFIFRFRGRAAGIAIASGPDAGKIEFSIDDGAPQTIDLFTQWSGSLHLPWYLVLADNLIEGEHTLKVEILNDQNEKSKGYACRIVHFLVNE